MELNRTITRIAGAALGLLMLGAISATAQTDMITRTQTFTTDGIDVILTPSGNGLVSVIIGLEGGPASGETNNPALGPFTSDLITSSGSTRYSKDDLRKFGSRTSTSIIGEGDLRGISYVMTATAANFDRAWEMLAGMILDPAFDTLEYRNIMQQRVAQANRRWSSPEAQASIIADSLTKLGNPLLSLWTRREDVEAVTIPMMREFQKKLSERSRFLVVIVGDIPPALIREKLKAFASLPLGNYKRPKIPALVRATEPALVIADKETPTTYVAAEFVGPAMTDADYWPMQIGMSHLRSNLFEEIRTKRNLSYAPQSYLTQSYGQTAGVMSVSSTLPDSAFPIMLDELDKMRRGSFDAADLEASKQVYITAYYMGRTTTAGKARAIFSAERNAGDWRKAFAFDAINSVTKAAVERAFRKYANTLMIGIAGPKAKITESKFRPRGKM